MSNPLNLSKFKKHKIEKDHTVLKHEDGHEIRILHSKISPEMKKKLDGLEHFSEGGYAGLKENYRADNFKQAHKRGQSIVNKQIHRYADGGAVKKKGVFDELEEKIRESFNAPTPIPSPTPTKEEEYDRIRKKNRENFGGNYADGGEVPKKPEPINQDRAQEVQDSMRKAFNFADGGQAVQGEEQPVNASKLESMYAPEEEAAQQASQPQASNDPHADLAAAIKNMSQVYAANPQSAPIPQQTPQQTVAPSVDTAGSPTPPPSQGPVASPMVSTSPQVPPMPQGTLPQQAIQGMKQQNKAEMMQAGNTQASMGQQADIQGQQAQRMQDLHAKYEEMGNKLHHAYETTAEEISQGKIDPSNWWNSKSTGSKVLTAIGMLFAGAGGGIAGNPELASKAIDSAIERDIEGQKANLANKQSLLSKYMDMYNDLPQAEAAARLTMSAATEGLLAQQALKLGSANAVEAAKATIAARRQSLLPHMESLAKGQVMSQMYNEMGKPQQQSSNQEENFKNRMNQLRMVNPDMAKNMESSYIPSVGVASRPLTEKTITDIAMRKDLSDKLAQLEVFAKKHEGTTMDRAIVNQGKAMAQGVKEALRIGLGMGALSGREAEGLSKMIPDDPTAFLAKMRTLPGYRSARKANDDTLKTLYKSYGVKPFQDQQGNQNQEAMEWLKQNPDHPKAAAVRKKLGI